MCLSNYTAEQSFHPVTQVVKYQETRTFPEDNVGLSLKKFMTPKYEQANEVLL
jgi:hypothetical protein